MFDCRHCGQLLKGNPEDYRARCPVCREPLYERSDEVRRRRDTEESRGGVCAVHPGNVAVGPCRRCGTFMCGLCRSRWNDRSLCTACVERLIGSGEGSSDEVQTHRWQAVVSVLLAFAAWILALPLIAIRGGADREVVVGMLVLAIASLLPALFGLGQAAAAIRVRGDRLVLATCGLVLSGAQIGAVTGIVVLVIWKQ